MPNGKIQSPSALQAILSRLTKAGKKIVFTNGCFDLLHIGHVKLFEKAKSYGDVLVVGLNSDHSLRRLKGSGRPLVSQKSRAQLLAALEPIDYITIFNEDTPARLIARLKPDLLIKGGDYKLADIVGRQDVKKVVRFPLVKGYSTTALIKKIVRYYGKT